MTSTTDLKIDFILAFEKDFPIIDAARGLHKSKSPQKLLWCKETRGSVRRPDLVWGSQFRSKRHPSILLQLTRLTIELVRSLLWFIAIPLLAQFRFEIPEAVKQGEVIRIKTNANGKLHATLGKTSVPLFPDGNGGMVGLLPIAVTDKTGVFDLVIRTENEPVLFTAKVNVQDGKYPIQNISASSSMKSLTPLPGEMEAMKALNTTVTPEKLYQTPFQLPTSECRNSPFGVLRYYNGKPSGNFHRGLDLRSPMGTPIHAPAAGTVKVAQMFRLHGGTVGLDHGQGVTSHYLHMSKVAAVEGQLVKAGDILGYVGSTGFATGPHLHWGLYVHSIPTNPERWVEGLRYCPTPAPVAKKTIAKKK